MRTELGIGLLLFALILVLKMLFPVPELAMGFTLGLALCFELTGLLPEKIYNRIKQN